MTVHAKRRLVGLSTLLIAIAMVIGCALVITYADQTENVEINSTGEFGADPDGTGDFDRQLMMKGNKAESQTVHPQESSVLQGEVGEVPVVDSDLTISSSQAAKVADANDVVRGQTDIFVSVSGDYVGGSGASGTTSSQWTTNYNRGEARIFMEINSDSAGDDNVAHDLSWSTLTIELLAGEDEAEYSVALTDSGTGDVTFATTPVVVTKAAPKVEVVLTGVTLGEVTITGTYGAKTVETTATVVKPIKTPNGDPTTTAGSNAGNERTYSTAAANPTVTVPCEANPVVKDTSTLRWTIQDVGTREAAWDSHVDGQTGTGQGLTTTATYTNLPNNYDDFGAKTITLAKAGAAGNSTQTVEIFFPKTATNHPGGQAGSPNWYHYWKQATGTAANLTYQTGGNFGEVKAMTEWAYNNANLPAKNQITIQDAAAGADPGDALNRIHGQLATTGIAAFWDTAKHESIHVDQIAAGDGMVAIAAGTPWHNGWSWVTAAGDNHWDIGPDGKPGVPNVDDDGVKGVDDLQTTGPSELGMTTASNDVQVIAVGKGKPNQTCITAGVNLITAPGGDDQIVGGTITTGADGICNTAKAGNDAQDIAVNQGQPNQVCITAGPDDTLDSTPGGDDQTVGDTITTGANGKCETAKANDDIQVIPLNQGKPGQTCVSAGTNLVTTPYPGSDDTVAGATIHTGADGICSTKAVGNDTQDIALNQGKANETCITDAGDGLQTTKAGDDVLAGNTIHTGPNGICQTAVGNLNGTDDVQLDTLAPAQYWPDALGAPPAPPYAGGWALEQVAYDAEPDDDTKFARKDWGDPGKNHKTLDKYND